MNLLVEDTLFVALIGDLFHTKIWFEENHALCCLSPSSRGSLLRRDEHIQALTSVLTLCHLSDKYGCFEIGYVRSTTLFLSSYTDYDKKSYFSTVHFRRITSIYQPTNAHIFSNKTLLKHFKTLRHVSILSDHHLHRSNRENCIRLESLGI